MTYLKLPAATLALAMSLSPLGCAEAYGYDQFSRADDVSSSSAEGLLLARSPRPPIRANPRPPRLNPNYRHWHGTPPRGSRPQYVPPSGRAPNVEQLQRGLKDRSEQIQESFEVENGPTMRAYPPGSGGSGGGGGGGTAGGGRGPGIVQPSDVFDEAGDG